MTVIIMDNLAIAMTGGQETRIPSSHIKDVVLGLGVNPDHVHVVDAQHRSTATNTALLRREIEYPGLSVIIAVRECVETALKKKQEKVRAK